MIILIMPEKSQHTRGTQNVLESEWQRTLKHHKQNRPLGYGKHWAEYFFFFLEILTHVLLGAVCIHLGFHASSFCNSLPQGIFFAKQMQKQLEVWSLAFSCSLRWLPDEEIVGVPEAESREEWLCWQGQSAGQSWEDRWVHESWGQLSRGSQDLKGTLWLRG